LQELSRLSQVVLGDSNTSSSKMVNCFILGVVEVIQVLQEGIKLCVFSGFAPGRSAILLLHSLCFAEEKIVGLVRIE
jgi:hypothetical protein